ncbi:MAG: hypothetical protein NTZ38_00390, partial [Candidatus Taylorbacteria bacterium]|nr:hypothetical protein [Candidatus Taylorbacteria bacterium]
MAIFYPRKQTVLIFIVCIGIIVALIAYKDAQNPQDIGTEATSMSLRIQSDNDRSDMLATTSPTSIDWQKQFLAGGPTAAIKLNSKPGTSQVKDAPLTLTDRISQDLFAQFMTAHQAGLDSDPDVINGISQRFIDHVSQAATPVQYTLRDIS